MINYSFIFDFFGLFSKKHFSHTIPCSSRNLFTCWHFYGRELLCVAFMVFTLRLIHIFAIHKELGPKIVIVGKMVKDVFFFLFFLGVWIMAYGVANQALLYPRDPNFDRIFRRVFYRPYLHIYGQIPVEEVDAIPLSIQLGIFPFFPSILVILLMVYLLVTNILLINLLIAMFSNTFTEVQANSEFYWKFQRYNLIVQYHCSTLFFFAYCRLFNTDYMRVNFMFMLPSALLCLFVVLQLSQKAANRLMTWETIQKEDFLTAQNKIQQSSDSQRLLIMMTMIYYYHHLNFSFSL
uniref:Ion transport domain-containing protein n=1 Tax=Xiphophorus couchianus TaxID=32473 RepID=A0A3B5L3C4_9TELE